MNFEKYQATGNDFVIINNINNDINIPLTQKFVADISHRRFGVGADGLIVVEQSRIADFRMLYFNSDGLEGTFCGNGSRCISMFAYKNGIAPEKMQFEASDGMHKAMVIDEELVSVEMQSVDCVKEVENGYFLDTGSPHLVKIVNDLSDIDVYVEGKALSRRSELFEKETNVNFVEISNGVLKVATFERGVEDETYSCGTGAIASAIVFNKYHDNNINNIKLLTKGGELHVSFVYENGVYNNITLTGPAKKVFKGEYF